MIINGKPMYHNVLNIPESASGAFRVTHRTHPAGTEFLVASARTRIMGGDRGAPIRYPHPTRWHELTQDGGTWMTDLPIEQAQHDAALRPVRGGTVLVGGLGLGYAATALARRSRVTRVVVVEVAPDVVALVAPSILADDPAARAKVEIVTADLFDYLRAPGETFASAFYDIWSSDGEMTFFGTVCPLRRLSVGRVRGSVVCWNEHVMRGQLYFSLHSRHAIATAGVKRFPGAQTLDQLAAIDDDRSPWLAWSAQVFRWVVERRPDAERVEAMMLFYAGRYGFPDFPPAWRALSGLAFDDRVLCVELNSKGGTS